MFAQKMDGIGIAEEHLQAAAEIGRVSNISLEKLTELLALFYLEDE